MHACMHACMHAYIHTYIHTYTHAYAYTYTYTYTYTYMVCVYYFVLHLRADVEINSRESLRNVADSYFDVEIRVREFCSSKSFISTLNNKPVKDRRACKRLRNCMSALKNNKYLYFDVETQVRNRSPRYPASGRGRGCRSADFCLFCVTAIVYCYVVLFGFLLFV